MKKIWVKVNELNIKKENKIRFFLISMILIWMLIGGIAWLLVGKNIWPSYSELLVFIGLPGAFIGLYGSIIYLYNHNFA